MKTSYKYNCQKINSDFIWFLKFQKMFQIDFILYLIKIDGFAFKKLS